VVGYGVTKAGVSSEIGGIAFTTSTLLMSLLYMRYGVFDIFIGVVIIIAEAMILVYLLQKIFAK
jgi:hypothetical protein